VLHGKPSQIVELYGGPLLSRAATYLGDAVVLQESRPWLCVVLGTSSGLSVRNSALSSADMKVQS